MSLQYARLYQLRSALQLLDEEGSMTKSELTEALRQRKALGGDQEKTEGADDIIEQLQSGNLITKVDDTYQLTKGTDESRELNSVLIYSGEEAVAAGDDRAQGNRILANLMYEHPMLIILTKFVYRNGPVKMYELKQEFNGEEFLGDKLNQFTIEVGMKLLNDADVIESTNNGFIKERWPIRVFAHIVHEEYNDLVGNRGSVAESELFERIEMLYGVSQATFDRLLTRLHSDGIVSERSYGELILNEDVIEEANIYE